MCNRHERYLLRQRIKYAWQRAVRGYDDSEVRDICGSYRIRLIKLLEEFRKIRQSAWVIPVEYQNEFGFSQYYYGSIKIFTHDQVDAILDTLIFHLKLSSYDGVKAVRPELTNYDQIVSIERQNRVAAAKLLLLFWDRLWD